MIIARIKGGVGNQLFIYAAARRLALANRTQLFLDCTTGFEHDVVYRRNCQLNHFHVPSNVKILSIKTLFCRRIKLRLSKLFNRLLPFRLRSYLCQDGNDFDSRLMHLRFRRNIYLEGYWQSERYFKDVEATIRQDLKIIPPADYLNKALSERIMCSVSVAVHIRFFDNPDEPGKNNISESYYINAIAAIQAIAPEAHYFVFSDQPSAALDRVAFPEGRVTVISHNQGDENAYADLWLMSLCQHFIIANSTFSWWGAWLSERHGKRVIAPSVRISCGKMAWGFDGLLPDEWIKL